MTQRRLMVGLIWLMMFVAYFDRVNITVAGPAIVAELGLGPAAFGGILSAFTLGYALMQIPGGYLADRFGARRLLIGALILWSLFTGLTGLATSFTALVVVRMCFGVGEGLENGAQFKLIGDWFTSRERSAANAVFLTALSLGPAVAAPLAAWCVVHFGWHALFFWCTLPGLLVAGLLAMWLPRGEPTAAPQPMSAEAPATDATGWNRVTTWLTVAAYLGFNVAFWGFIGWMPTYLNAARHIALAQLGAAAAVPYVCGFAGTVVCGWLGSTVFAKRRPLLVAGGYVLAGAALLLAFNAHSTPGCLTGLSVAAFGLYGGFGPFWAIALDLAPARSSGTFTGLVNLGGQVGGFCAPIVVGAVVAATKSFAGGFGFMISALGLAVASLVCLDALIGRRAGPTRLESARPRPA